MAAWKRAMKLIPKTLKGKNKIHEAGTDCWEIEKKMDSVPCLQGRPGMLIRPVLDDEDTVWWKKRWVCQSDDPDFDFQF